MAGRRQPRASAGRRTDAARPGRSRRLAGRARRPTRVLARVEVEDELPLGVAGNPAEERGAVVGVVDRAEDRRRRDRRGGRVVVQVALLDRGPRRRDERAQRRPSPARRRRPGSAGRARAGAHRGLRRRRRGRAPRRPARARHRATRPGPRGARGRRARPRTPRPTSPRPCARTARPSVGSLTAAQRLGVLADEARHAARMPQRVPREKAAVGDLRPVVRHDRAAGRTSAPSRPASRGSRGRCPRRSGGSPRPSRRARRASRGA